MKERLHSLAATIPIIIFFVFTVLLYGPLSLYIPNSQELWFTIGIVWKVIIPISAAAFIIIAVFFLIIPPKAAPFFQKLLFGVSLGFYVQGNLVKTSYGVLDGSEIDWSSYHNTAIINTIVWAVCIAAPFIVSFIVRKKKGLIQKVLMAAALFLTVIQIPAMAMQLISYEPNGRSNLKVTTEGMYELSGKENTVIVILDAMDEMYYREFLESHPDYTDELNGFTHFDNTLASGSRTMIGVPTMLTGIPYVQSETSYSDYLSKIWSGDNPLYELDKSGYNVHAYVSTLAFSTEASPYIENFSSDGGRVGSYKTLAKKLYKLDLFKFVPHIFKARFWFNTTEFEDARLQENTYKSNDPKFFGALVSDGYHIDTSSDKQFLLYHLNGAHSPFNMNENMEKVSKGNLKDQVAGCFKGIQVMLQQMKALGVYDAANIVITADHGDIKRGENPLLLVKPAGSTEGYSTTHVPASSFDLPIFLADIAGMKLDNQIYGKDLFSLEEGEVRERHFFFNTSGNSRIIIEEYSTLADADQRDLMTLENTFQKDPSESEPYILGTTLSFAKDATGNNYTTEGFWRNTGFYTVLRGPYSELYIPVKDAPADRALSAHLGLNSKSKPDFDLVITANDVEVYHNVVDSSIIKAGIDFEIPAGTIGDSGELVLRFAFPDVPSDQMELGVEERTWTLTFYSLVIQ